MTRSRNTRRLVVGTDTYLWSVRHAHDRDAERGTTADCREILSLRKEGARGRLGIVFRQDPDPRSPSSTVGDRERGWLNLHQPGVVRAFLDAALAHGWDPDSATGQETDGWTLFPDAQARRA
ncbi:hypothetical protein [Streptomyces sparsogenes]|uniref:Uncharacterized protein n=1 Tax=Streptomyces sparsogenes DSM 40356 TaxID=1331668 RepID=A0A1R1S4D3_9ACTN|nr:hypothetical protein [Streptomyces sparsogenes]OMI33160.1 hypothetical protein SPAR_42901 [Streptomyces sparsogenes DSM 40356]